MGSKGTWGAEKEEVVPRLHNGTVRCSIVLRRGILKWNVTQQFRLLRRSQEFYVSPYRCRLGVRMFACTKWIHIFSHSWCAKKVLPPRAMIKISRHDHGYYPSDFVTTNRAITTGMIKRQQKQQQQYLVSEEDVFPRLRHSSVCHWHHKDGPVSSGGNGRDEIQ